MVTRYDEVREALQTPAVFGNRVVEHARRSRPPPLPDPPEPRRQGPRRLPPRRQPVVLAGLGQAHRATRPRALRRDDRGAATGRALRHDGRVRDDVRDRDVPRHPRSARHGRCVHAAPGGDDLRRLLRRRPGRAGRGRRRDQGLLRRRSSTTASSEPGDLGSDFVSFLLQAKMGAEPISREEILTLCMTIMLAGLDTTRSALGYIFHHLATHDDDRQLLIDAPRAHPRRRRGVHPPLRAGVPGRPLRQPGRRLPRLPDEGGRHGVAGSGPGQPRPPPVRAARRVRHRPRRSPSTSASAPAPTAASAPTSPAWS